tara:strand:+ start:32429 stop:34060 length:1632 start_codon:yes stop_codon:yes gene_type:complete
MDEKTEDQLAKFEELQAQLEDTEVKAVEEEDEEIVEDDEEVVEDEEEKDLDPDEEVDEDEEGQGERLERVPMKPLKGKKPSKIGKKAAAIYAQLEREADEDEEENPDVPEVFLAKSDFDDKCHAGEYLSIKEYDELDEDAKDAYEMIQVFDEDSKKGYGMRWRRHGKKPKRRMPIEDTLERKEKFYDSAEEAAEAALEIGCEGYHEMDGKFMPCQTHESYLERTGQGEAQRLERAPMEGMEKSEDFLCGFQRKSVQAPCDFCRGGCAPEDGLPGLADIEQMVMKSYEGSQIISSGYSNVDDIFVVDVKRADNSAIEVFLSGEGDELGWLKIDDELLEEVSKKSLDIISTHDAEDIAIKTLGGEASSVTADVFNQQDVYVVEVNTFDEKSYDVFVSTDGRILGYDEYSVESPLSEDEEIKALEAELNIKRMYSREQREEMAENGEALEDGSFPIADEADLKNAIQAFGRAGDKAAAKAHIMKRAEELGLDDLIPADWLQEGSPPADAPDEAARLEDEKGLEDADVDLKEALKEFEELKRDNGLS